MKRIYSKLKVGSKSTVISTGLIILCVVLLITGIIFLLIEPIKRYNRKKISENAISVIESGITSSETGETDDTEETVIPTITYVVPVKGNEVEGEGYDFVGLTEEYDGEEYYEESVALNSIGILEISSINLRYPVWDEATLVSLRYGLGHYEGSVMPGEVGNATIFGHNYRDGTMFQRLWDVEIGDEVVFTDLEGNEQVFYVFDTMVIDAEDILDYVVDDITRTRQLTLVTCTYIDGEEGYRLLVICRKAD